MIVNVEKKGHKVSNCFIKELENLIALAGFDKDKEEDLRRFAEIGGGSKDGISWVKINWVLKDKIVPREDFLYCLAEVAISIRGAKYYFKEGISNPRRYELNRFLLMCDYIPQSGNIFPVSEKFRRCQGFYVEKYVEFIPPIFWNITIPFEEALAVFDAFVPKGGLEVKISENMCLFLKKYSCQHDGILKPAEASEESQSNEAFGFKLINTERKARFATIEAIRQVNSALIPITLINGNWIDIMGTLWCDYDYDLNIENYYNYLDLIYLDYFFDVSEGNKIRGMFNISDLNKLLKANPEYQEVYKRLTLEKSSTEK